MNAPIMQRRVAHRIFKCFVVSAVFCAVAITTLLASLWLEHRTEVTLPTPTGPFAVGRVLCYWTDAETVDTLAPVPGTKRELLVWIWYPAAGGKATAIADYLPARLRAAVEHNRSPLIGTLLTRDLSTNGIRLVGTRRLLGQKVHVLIPRRDKATPWKFRVRILWTCAIGDDLIENGGTFIEVSDG